MGIRAAAEDLSLKIRTRTFGVFATLRLLRHEGPTTHSRNHAPMEIFKKLNDNELTTL